MSPEDRVGCFDSSPDQPSPGLRIDHPGRAAAHARAAVRVSPLRTPQARRGTVYIGIGTILLIIILIIIFT